MSDSREDRIGSVTADMHSDDSEFGDSVVIQRESATEPETDDDTRNRVTDTGDYETNNISAEECIPLPEAKTGEPYVANKVKKRYSVNPDFNNLYNNETNKEETTATKHVDQPWMPTVLREETWPEENSAFMSDIANGVADIHDDPRLVDDVLHNPLQSTIKETVIMKEDRASREKADWKKVQMEEEFNMMISNNRLKDLPTDQSSIPNTFANKINRNLGKNYVSPMKLFGYDEEGGDDERKGSGVGSKLPIVMENSEGLYKKILRNSSSNGNLIGGKHVHVDDADEDTNNENVNEDITSDAEEFSSFPSTTRKLFNAGEKLFENIKNGYHDNNRLEPVTQSDYTSAEEDNDGNGRTKNGTTAHVESHANVNDVYANMVQIKPSVDTIRNQFNAHARAYNNEFNVTPPKLQSKFRSNTSLRGEAARSNTSRKLKGMNFIPADDYRDKVFDKNLNTFVAKSDYVEGNSTNSSYTDDFETRDYSDGRRYTEVGDDDEEEDDNLLMNFSTSDLDLTNASVKKMISKASMRTLGSIDESGTEVEDGEVSFSMTDKFLVECISESYPVEKWSDVERLDINDVGLEQLFHLDKMTPNIWFLNASNNQISQNFGIPKKVQYLDLSFNLFSNISAKFDEFVYLQVLNLSNNKISDLRCLKELRNLTSLNLSYNEIENIDYLENFKMLHYLNLSNNQLKGSIDFSNYTMWFLEDLIVDDNEIEEIVNICELSGLINISVNNNFLQSFTYYYPTDNFRDDNIEPHLSLRRVSVNNNQLKELDLGMYVELKEVQFDSNDMLNNVDGMSTFIEKLSSRFNKNPILITNVLKFSLYNNNLKNLCLSGSRLPKQLPVFKDKFSSVTNLDISAMSINELPSGFGNFFPLLIDINLNFNRLQRLKGLEKVAHLKFLKLLGNDIMSFEDVVDYTSKIRMHLKMLDLRANPVTQTMYPFVFYNEEDASNAGTADESTALAFQLQEAEDIHAFAVEYARLHTPAGLRRWAGKSRRHDRAHRNKMSPTGSVHAGTLGEHRAAVLTWFPRLSLLDGILLSRHDREIMVHG